MDHPGRSSTTLAISSKSGPEGVDGVVVVIEDDPALARMLRLVLEQAAFEVQMFTSSLLGLPGLAVSVARPTAVVLDMNVSGMDMRETYNRARDVWNGASVLLLSISGAAEARFELGAQDWLSKPFDPETLIRKIRQLLAAAA